ncbi:MAG: hypothetical protein ACHQIG_03825 [Acidimicrobiia bacterium]
MEAVLVEDDGIAELELLVLLAVAPSSLSETTAFDATALETTGVTASAPVIPTKLARLVTSAIFRPRRARWTRGRGAGRPVLAGCSG